MKTTLDLMTDSQLRDLWESGKHPFRDESINRVNSRRAELVAEFEKQALEAKHLSDYLKAATCRMFAMSPQGERMLLEQEYWYNIVTYGEGESIPCGLVKCRVDKEQVKRQLRAAVKDVEL